MEMYLMIGGAIFVSAILYFGRHIFGGFFGLYRIVPVNEAHVRIMRNKKDVFSARDGKTAYWFIPFITKLHKLPLTNLAIPVNDIKLNDMNMAKFVCDIMCFVNIDNINLAVERLSLTHVADKLGFDFVRLSDDMRAIMESIGRTTTTKQSIQAIYMNRQALDEAITKEVMAVFPKWGIQLVDLELKDIKDAPNSTIIADIERKIAAEIRRDAEIKVAETTKEAEVIKAKNEEEYRKRQIEKDREIMLAEQEKNLQVQQQTAKANEQAVIAKRAIEVGTADVNRQVIEKNAEASKLQTVITAEGEAKRTLVTGEANANVTKIVKIAEAEGNAEAIRKVGQADADRIKTVGTSEADILRLKKVADAEGTTKLAEAMKLYNDVALQVQLIGIQKEILLAKYNALAKIGENADIRWIMSGANGQKFFGLNLDAEGGANLQQFLNESGIDLSKITNLLAQHKDEKGIK